MKTTMDARRRLLAVSGLVTCILAAAGTGWNGLGQVVPPGFDAASFARFGLGTRALGMAGAYVPVAEGAMAGYWNPAGLAMMTDLQVEGMYANWLGADIHFQYVSAAGHPQIGEDRLSLRLGEQRLTLGVTWMSVRIADIPWSEDDVVGTFDAWSHQVMLSLGFQVSEANGVNAGLSVKFYHDSILEGRSFGLGVDLGLLWRTEVRGVPVRFGLCTTDAGGSRVKWYGTTGEPVNHVPWIVRAGAAAEFQVREARVLCAAGYEWGADRPRFERLRVGVEIAVAWFALRGGWDQPLADDPGRWTVGLGIALGDWGMVEYALLPGKLGDTNLIALRLTL